MQLDKNDVIRIRAAALKSLKDSGLRERALAGSKHHDDFIYCEKEFINLFSDAMDGLLNAQTSLTGIELIAQERQRQIEVEGWTVEHDKQYTGEKEHHLALAAACYAIPALHREYKNALFVPTPLFWPWLNDWWKPSPDNRIRELVKAGALIAAEIDRLQATEGKQEGGGQ